MAEPGRPIETILSLVALRLNQKEAPLGRTVGGNIFLRLAIPGSCLRLEAYNETIIELHQ